MKKDALTEALRNRKGAGFNLNIILGDEMGEMEEPEDENKKIGLAPEVPMKDMGSSEEKVGVDPDPVAIAGEEGHEDASQDVSLIMKILSELDGPMGKRPLASRGVKA